MNELLNVLYEKFLMRDLVGKLGPGFVTGSALLAYFDLDVIAVVPADVGQWILVALLPAMWSLGVALQILAEFIGLHSASPRPRWVLFYPTWGSWQKVNSDLDERIALIGSATWTESARQQRERFVYLKEASGNFGAASLVAAALALHSGAGLLSGKFLVLLVIATGLFLSHLVHAVR